MSCSSCIMGGTCGCPGDPTGEEAKCDPDAADGFVIRRRMNRSETFVIEYQLVDSDGAPIDVTTTGSQLWFTIKDWLTKADSQANWQGTYGNGIEQPSVGTIVVTVPASATQFLADGVVKLYYDLRYRDSDGRVTTVEKGLFDVAPGVTRSI